MSTANRHFVRHYIEMVVVMFVGMGVLAAPALVALNALGVSSAERHDAPAALLLGMAVSMTVPMVAWMRYRGHGWAPSMEMAASMFIPTFGVLALLWAGIGGLGALMTIQHVVMLPAMLVAMLLRRDEYSGGHDAHQPEVAV
jgi:hypothetical protein